MKSFVASAVVPLLVLAAGAAPPPPSRASGGGVRVGLEVLEAEGGGFGFLKGRKVGLVAHSCSTTSDGRHAIDVLRQAGVQVVRIYAAERALRVRGAIYDKVPHNLDGTPVAQRGNQKEQTWADVGTGLPIVGLFGEKARLKAEDLQGIDTLVFDVQDAGVRPFNVTALVVLAMDAAAEAGVELVVLDRPNPLGGERVEGPEADGWGPRQKLITTVAPGPLIPGLTVAEMAQLVNARRDKPARLRVVPMKGWKRSMLWPDTGRAWPVPSPNLRTFEGTVAYAGVVLLETTTVSEGRGTESPFQLIGAPGLDGAPLAALSVPGFSLTPARFTPRQSSAAAPKHSGTACLGVRIEVTQPRNAHPYQLGVSLLKALRAQGALSWNSPAALDEFLGTPRVRAAIERGDSVAAMVAADAAALEAFQKERARALLY